MRPQRIIIGMALLFWGFSQVGFARTNKEIKLGFYTDREVLSAQTVVFNDTLDKRINNIGNRLVQVSDRPDIEYTVRVINDPTINAYAAAGGFVYINTGLLDILESKDELAAILGHEIAHISKSHQIDFIHSVHQKRAAGSVVGFALAVGLGVAGAAAAGPAPSPTSPSYSSHQQLSSALTRIGMQTGSLLGEATAISMIKGYGKKQELEADALAIQYTKRANYDPNALVDVFKRLASIRNSLKINEQNYISSLINAEPGLEERIKQAGVLMNSKVK